MGLARLYSGVTGLGQVLINKLGVSGGPRADRVNAELDNLVAWAQSAVRHLHLDTSTVGNVAAGLDNLHSFTLPAGTLATNNDYVNVCYRGFCADTNVSKRIQTSIDAQVTENTGALSLGGGAGTSALDWQIDATYLRLTATSVRSTVSVRIGQLVIDKDGVLSAAGSCAAYFNRTSDITVANLNSNAVVLLVQAEATNNNDVVQNQTIIHLRQQ